MKKLMKGLLGAVVLASIILCLYFQIDSRIFYEDKFSSKEVYDNIAELSSDKYQGRLAGSSGNLEALRYVENFYKKNNISYKYQNFNTMVPEFEGKPVFELYDKNGKLIKAFEYGKDFREILGEYGNSGDIKGKLVSVGKDLGELKDEDIKGSILVSSFGFSNNEKEIAIAKGCAGFLETGDDIKARQLYDYSDRLGKGAVDFSVDNTVISQLQEESLSGCSAHLSLKVHYVLKNTPNLIAVVRGKDDAKKTYMFSSHIDGFGVDLNGNLLAGSLKGGSGTAYVMELAKTIQNQNNKPDANFIFVLFNSTEFNNRGSVYYRDNPMYPLEDTEIINLDVLGVKGPGGIITTTYGNVGQAIASKIGSFAAKENLEVKQNSSSHQGDISPFLLKGFTAVNLSSETSSFTGNSVITGKAGDNIDNIGIEKVQSVGNILTQLVKREMYGDIFSSLLNIKTFFIVLALMVLFICVEIVNNCSLKEMISIRIFKSIAGWFLILIVSAIVIISISFMPKNFDVVSFNGGFETNNSVYLIFNNVVHYISDMVKHGTGKTADGFSILFIMSYSILRSMLLIFASMTFAFLIGTVKGAYDGTRIRKNNYASIMLLSLPDVLIVLLMQLFGKFLYDHNMLLFLLGGDENTRFIMPFICLAILPAVYISRIAQVEAREEMQKDYVQAARAKGLSQLLIFKNHILRGVVIKVVESLPSVLSIVMSNLIIVEYLFNYPGIVYDIFSYYKEGDINATIGLIFGLGIMYFIIMFIFRILIKLVNPLKREGLN